MTLQSELARLKDLEAKATPGPWGIERTVTTNWIGPMRPSGKKIDTIVFHNDREDLIDVALLRNDRNADFVAAMRNALPKLIKTIEIQQEVIRKVKSNRDGKEQIEALWTE